MYRNTYSGIDEGTLMIIGLIALVLGVLVIAGQWTTFKKAGKHEWAAIVPIYATIVVVQTSRKPMWWAAVILLGAYLPIPIIGPIAALVGRIVVCTGVAESFGKSAGFGIGLVFLPFIFYPILGFGDAQYVEGNEQPKFDDEVLDV